MEGVAEIKPIHELTTPELRRLYPTARDQVDGQIERLEAVNLDRLVNGDREAVRDALALARQIREELHLLRPLLYSRGDGRGYVYPGQR